MSRIALAAILAATVAAPRADGQDVRVLRQRLDAQVKRAADAWAGVNDYRSVSRRLKSATDTIAIANGTITFYTHRDIAPVVREAAAKVDSVLPVLGSLVSIVSGAAVYIERDTSRRPFRGPNDDAVEIRYSVPPRRVWTPVDAKIDADEIARMVEGTTLGRVVDHQRTPFIKWRRGNLPMRKEDIRRSPDWGAVRFEVLDSPSLLAPRCYKGDIVACSMLLGFTPVDQPVMVWYDSLTRVNTVRLYESRARRSDDQATSHCLAGNDSACGRALDAFGMYRDPPSGGFARDALISQALQMGGDGALERLLTSQGSPAEAIAAAAKVPTDSVIRLWQRNLREGSLGSDAVTPGLAIAAVAWILVLLFLSTRITRWR